MSNATKLPALAYMTFVQLSRPDAPNPRLSNAISATSTVLKFVEPLLGSDAVVITESMLLGVRKSDSYVETVLVPSGSLAYDAQTANFTVGSVLTGGTSGAKGIVVRDSDSGTTGTLTLIVYSGTFQDNETITDVAGGSATVNGTLTRAISADGLTATGCVRGINLDGLDWITGDTDLAVSHKAGDAVFCNISGIIGALLTATLTGTIATGGAGFTIGTEPGASGETTTLYRTTTPGTKKGFFRWNANFAQFSNDGTTWVNCSDVSASNLTAISAADTTPGYLNDKISGTNISKSITNPAGNEVLNLTAQGTLANVITDVTASKDEINQVNDGVSANVTATNLNTLTAGAASNASALHSHTQSAISLTAGEAIDGSVSAVPVGMSTGGVDYIATGSGGNVGGTSAGGVNFGNADSAWKISQSFTYTNAYMSSIVVPFVNVAMRKVSAPTDNIFATIQTDSGGVPSGTVITNGTSNNVDGSTLTASANVATPVTFTFATPPTLTSGTKYHVVVNRVGAPDAVNYYTVMGYSSSVYASQGRSTYTLSTTTWGNFSVNDLFIYVELTITADSKVYKLDADNLDILNYMGWTKSNVAANAAIDVIYSGEIDTLTGLTAGREVYASATAGAYSHTAPATELCAVIPLGTATSSTKMLIDNAGITLANGTNPLVNQASSSSIISTDYLASGTVSYFVKTGFRPGALTALGTYRSSSSTRDNYAQIAASSSTRLHNRVLDITPAGSVYTTAQTNASYATASGFNVSQLAENGFYVTGTAGNVNSTNGATFTGFIASA